MKKVSVSVFILLTIYFGLTCKLSAQISAKDHLITADIQKISYVFDKTIQVIIKYKNNGKNDWKLQKPDNALSVVVYFARIGDTEHALPYTMGNIQTIPGSQGAPMAFVMPETYYIIIKAGEEYTVTRNIPWSGLIFPGKWILWVKDETEEIQTETAEFEIVFTKESVDILLDIAKNIEENRSKRKWYTEFLYEIKTDMPEFEWPRYDNSDSLEEKSRKEDLIQKNLKEFEDFWNKEKNSPNTEKAIERINKVCREITESSSSFHLDCPDILEFRR